MQRTLPIASLESRVRNVLSRDCLVYTYMALSKKSITPPIRNRPPTLFSQCPGLRNMRQVEAYRRSRRLLRFLERQVSDSTEEAAVCVRASNNDPPNAEHCRVRRQGVGRHLLCESDIHADILSAVV